MALLAWNDTLSVKVAEIDQQHMKLIGMINDLNDAMKNGQGKEILGKIINDLVAYAIMHFKLEERYFARYGYPDAESHQKEHAAFNQKVADFQ
jgi:hemerythrin